MDCFALRARNDEVIHYSKFNFNFKIKYVAVP